MSADHESEIRKLIARTEGTPYVSFRSLEEARSHPNGAVILEGDWGGQIYLTCPVALVACRVETLSSLLTEIDALCWREIEGANIVFEPHPTGAVIAGGMGGGLVTADIWVHPELEAAGLGEAIRDVIQGRTESLKRTGPIPSGLVWRTSNASSP